MAAVCRCLSRRNSLRTKCARSRNGPAHGVCVNPFTTKRLFPPNFRRNALYLIRASRGKLVEREGLEVPSQVLERTR